MKRALNSVVAAVAIGGLALAQPALATGTAHRAGSPAHGAEALKGNNSTFVVAAIASVVVVALLLAATDGHHHGDSIPDSPASP